MDFFRRLLPILLLFLSKMLHLSRRNFTFSQLEEQVAEATRWLAREVMTLLLEQVDIELMEARDTRKWRLVHAKTRSILTLFGEQRNRRRFYRNTETGETAFLLDDALGLSSGQRVSDRLKERMAWLATEVSYRRAAEILASWVPGVSAMSVWKAVQELGEAERRRAAESRRRVFERGEVPAGAQKAEELGVEADGVWIRARKARPEDAGFLEIKLGVAYEGRSENGRLKNRQAVAGVMEAEAFWEETVAQLGERWDLSVVRRIWLGGDGERWIKAGTAWLPGAVFRLDRDHLRRALLEALGSDREAYERVAEGIAQGDWNAVEEGLREAWVRATRRGKARVRRLEQYLRHNWEGIIARSCAPQTGQMLKLCCILLSKEGRPVKRTKSIPGSIKFKAALERIKGEKTLVELSREYGVHPNTLLKGKLTLLEKGAELLEPPKQREDPGSAFVIWNSSSAKRRSKSRS
ncbi:ISLre2 family transposase [Hydrogenibacillus schlegelii]|uniref:ISLre2 family transposase n=1 Tax=Hydrogenibacillus schlegelii TaxID=1484 RepID=UPI0034A0074E